MAAHIDHKKFTETLNSMPVGQQRRIAAKFIEKVLDLADERCLDNIVKLFSKPEIEADDLEQAYRRARSIYVDTHPHSDLSELNFDHQAKHFVAEACMTCVAPLYHEAKICHLAQKVAMYCRLARTCSSMNHDEDLTDFSKAEEATRRSVEEQYAILQDFLAQA
jgi:hypothetical protein